jgi:hypothetical protein
MPNQDLAESHVHLPDHRYVELRLVTLVRPRIDLPIDGLGNAGKPALRRLALLRVTDDVIVARITRWLCHLYSILAGLDGTASRAVLISRESSLVSRTYVAGIDDKRGNRNRDVLAPANTALDAGARAVPRDVYSTPKTEAEVGGVTGAQTLVAGGRRVDLHDCRSVLRHDIDLIPQRIRRVLTDKLVQ